MSDESEQRKLAQKIAVLDEINMSEVLQKVGTTFDREQRTQQVLSLFGWGARFVTDYHGDHLVGYLQYIQFPAEALEKLDFPEGTVEIGSLQVHPEYRRGNVLRRLFRQTFMLLSTQHVRVIRSTVQLSNDHSIRFHLRLGFKEFSRNQKMIDFRVDAQALRNQLYHNPSF